MATPRKCAHARSGMQGTSPGAVRRFRLFPVRRHRFVSCGFPRSFRLLLRPRGSAPGSASPGRLFNAPSIGFKSVKIVLGLSFVQAPHVRLSFIRPGSARLVPPCPAPLPRSPAQFGWPGSRRPGSPVYHPVPASCSARLQLVLFMVCISFRFGFSSVSVSVRFQFNSLVLSVSFSPVFVRFQLNSFVCPFRFRLFSFVFELNLVFARLLVYDFFIYFPRILYTARRQNQMHFLSENMSFLRNHEDF